jgi:predicted enzyme related to lactoylglutathione lyase
MERVIGIGGIFLKAKDPKALQAWYVRHLGFPETKDGYVVFVNKPDQREHAVWSLFPQDTTYFQPSEQVCMFNYRVADLEALLEVLAKEGVEIVGDIQRESYGKFGWIMDPEGNKIELWEPVVAEFDQLNKMT